MDRVDTLTSPPIVGRYYLVPCMYVSPRHCQLPGPYLFKIPGWWPIMGPRHEDREIINFPVDHVHYDVRFLNERQLRDLNKASASPEKALATVLPLRDDIEMMNGKILDLKLDGPEYRRLKCRREMPSWESLSTPPWLDELESKYADKTVRTCKTCPHRGIPLASLPVAADGGVTCPGHGLRWHAERGAMLRRSLAAVLRNDEVGP